MDTRGIVVRHRSGALRGRTEELRGRVVRIGTDPANDLVLPSTETSVAAKHAELVLRGDQLFVKDLGSPKGTLVSGKRIAGETRLEEGDEVQLGEGGPVIAASLAGSDTLTDGRATRAGAAPTPRPTRNDAENALPAIPGYELRERLAEGGMGIIYRAHHVAQRRDVAVKMVKSAHDEDSLNAEAWTTGFLDHPNVVSMYEVGRTSAGKLFMSMKLVGGVAWNRLLSPTTEADRKRAASFGVEQHLRVLVSVCNAVAFAHSKNIIHRDLKPKNVMVGEFGEVLVIDWGIAVDVGRGEASLRRARPLREAPRGAGDPQYWAPEIVDPAAGTLGPTTDIYLLGGILFEILTGSPPHANGRLDRLASAPKVPSDKPRELAAICRRALSARQAERFQSVTDFQKAVESYLERDLQRRESVALTTKAIATLASCKAARAGGDTVLYARFADAIAELGRALVLWPENETAIQGLRDARMAYANAALERGDHGLARAEAADLGSDAAAEDLRRRIAAALVAVGRRERLARHVRRALLLAIIVIVGGAAFGASFLQHEVNLAEEARGDAQREALDKEREALQKRREAARATRQQERAEAATTSAVLAEAVAKEQRDRAIRAAFESDVRGLTARVEALWSERARLPVSKDDPGDLVVAAAALVAESRRLEASAPVATAAAVGSSVATAAAVGSSVAALARSRVAAEALCQTVARETEDRLGTATPLGRSPGRLACVAFGEAGELAVGGDVLATYSRGTGRATHLLWTRGVTRSVAFSPDGELVASCQDDGGLRVFQVRDGQLCHERTGAERALVCTFAANGILVVGLDTGAVLVLDPLTGAERSRLEGAVSAVIACAVSRDGATIAAGSNGGTVFAWDRASGRLLDSVETRTRVRHCALSADGKRLCALAGGDVVVSPLPRDGEKIRKIEGPNKGTAIALSRDGALAAFYASGTLQIRDLSANRLVVSIPSPDGRAIEGAAFSTDGSQLATVTFRGRLDVFDVASGSHQDTFADLAPSFLMQCSAIAPAGELVATGESDGTVEVWDRSTGRLKHRLQAHEGAVLACVFTKDGRELLTSARDGTLKLWDAHRGSLLRSYAGLGDAAADSIAFTAPSGGFIMASSREGCCVWDRATGALMPVRLAARTSVRACASHPDGRTFTGHRNGAVTAWDSQGLLVGAHRPTEGPTVERLAISPDGRTVAIGADDGSVGLLDAASLVPGRSLLGHTKRILSIAWTPAGDGLATLSEDGSVRIWERSSGRMIRVLELPNYSQDSGEFRVPPGASCAFSRFGGELLIVAGSSIRRAPSPFATATLVSSKASNSDAPDGVQAVAASSDGRWVVTGDRWGVRLWDRANGHVAFTWRMMLEPTQVAIAQNRVFAVCASGHMAAFDAVTGGKVWTRRSDDDFEEDGVAPALLPSGVAFVASRDGSIAVIGTSGETLHEVEVEVAEDESVSRLVPSPDGRRLVVVLGESRCVMLDVLSGAAGPTLDLHSDRHDDQPLRVVGGGFLNAGEVLVVMGSPKEKNDRIGSEGLHAGSTYRLVVWDWRDGSTREATAGQHQDIAAFAVSPDGRDVLAGVEDTSFDESGRGTFAVWDVGSGRVGRVVDGHAQAIKALGFTADGRYALSGSADGTLRIWDLGPAFADRFPGFDADPVGAAKRAVRALATRRPKPSGVDELPALAPAGRRAPVTVERLVDGSDLEARGLDLLLGTAKESACPTTGLIWLNGALQLKCGRAGMRLAWALERGLGARVDLESAKAMRAEALKLQDPLAIALEAKKNNPNAAAAQLQAAASMGDRLAMVLLALEAGTLKELTKAAERNEPDAIVALAKKKKGAAAESLLRRGVEIGDPVAIMEYFTLIKEREPTTALDLLDRIGQLERTDVYEMLSHLYEHGIGRAKAGADPVRADFWRARSLGVPTELDQLRQSTSAAHRAQDWVTAERLGQRLVTLEEDRARRRAAYFGLATACMQLGKTGAALAALDEGQKHMKGATPRELGAHLVLRGDVLFRAEQYVGAVAAFEAAAKRTPEDAEVFLKEAWALEMLGDYDGAGRTIARGRELPSAGAIPQLLAASAVRIQFLAAAQARIPAAKLPAVVVSQIVPDSAADLAGLKLGDVILSVDGKATKSSFQLNAWRVESLRGADEAPKLTLRVSRPDQEPFEVRVPCRDAGFLLFDVLPNQRAVKPATAKPPEDDF